MEIVIDIPKYVYNTIIACDGYTGDCYNEKVGDAIKKGKLLPKGHGKLKDENEIFECIRNRVENLRNDTQFIKYRKDIDLLGTIPHIRNEVKTIIEADTESEE